jgi:hypothetical protein
MSIELGEYGEVCEKLWRDWLAKRFCASPYLNQAFDLSAAPEPYLSFDAGASPLVVLTTNPGGVLPFQRHETIAEGSSCLTTGMSYGEASAALGKHYLDTLRGAASNRIKKIRELATAAGYEGVLQVECCPFHSQSFPAKTKYIAEYKTDAFLVGYTDRLHSLLLNFDVLVVSAIDSRTSISREGMSSDWLKWQARLIGLAPQQSSLVKLLTKEGTVSCAALLERRDSHLKTMVLMMGGNHLPGNAGLETLAVAMKKARSAQS